jgi:hypothetical protein
MRIRSITHNKLNESLGQIDPVLGQNAHDDKLCTVPCTDDKACAVAVPQRKRIR